MRYVCLVLLMMLMFRADVRAQQCCRYEDTPVPTEHVSLRGLAIANVLTTGGMALVHAWLTGNMNSRSDALTAFAGGAVGGLGFYEAKRRIATDREWSGLALAHLSRSLVRNVSHGQSPLTMVCAGPGPVDVCLRTGLERGQARELVIEANALAVGAMVVLPVLGMRPAMRAGYLYFQTDRELGSRGDLTRVGAAFGRTVILRRDATESVWAHEMIHAVQAMQIGSVTPFLHLSSLRPPLDDERSGPPVRWDVQLDWLFVGVSALTELVPYHRQWTELEAYRLTRTPSHSGYIPF